MTTQGEISWKLNKLKEVIAESVDIKNDMKDLLGKATTDNFRLEVSRPSRDELYRIWQVRYNLLESNGKYNESWAKLLKRLEKTDNSLRLIATGLKIEDKLHLVFTDNEYRECFGMISLSYLPEFE